MHFLTLIIALLAFDENSINILCSNILINVFTNEESVGPPQFVAPDAQYASVLESVVDDVLFSRLQCYM